MKENNIDINQIVSELQLVNSYFDEEFISFLKNPKVSKDNKKDVFNKAFIISIVPFNCTKFFIVGLLARYARPRITNIINLCKLQLMAELTKEPMVLLMLLSAAKRL
mgnify:CR=1 FL=1